MFNRLGSFFRTHEATIAVVSSVAVGVWFINSALMDQRHEFSEKLNAVVLMQTEKMSDSNEKFNKALLESNEKHNVTVKEQNDKFLDLLKTIHAVDKQSNIRDKDIEMAFLKKNSEG